MVGLQIGDEVTFTIALNNKGEPQARNVMKREEALLLRAGAIHGMQGMQGMQGMRMSDGESINPNLMDEAQARHFQASLRGPE